MSQWGVLYRKELLGMRRSYKWLWVPLVFMLLGMMNPVTSYYMPQLLEANGLSQELIDAMPAQTGADILAKTLSQYNTIGLLILALSFMGVVAGERLSGTAVMVLVKPVSHAAYVTSKWAGMLSLTFVSLGLGYLATWYYTELLIGSVPFAAVLQSLLLYAAWLLFAATVMLLYGCLLNSPAGIAFLSLLTLAGLSLLSGLLGRYMKWSPGRLSAAAQDLIANGAEPGGLWLPLAVTAAAAAAMLAAAARLSARKAA